MKRMNYSAITSLLRRIHEARKRSDASGIPVQELLEQDRELRKRLLQEREIKKQRRDFLKAAGGLGFGAGMMSVNPLAFATHGGGSHAQPEIAIVGAGAGGLRTAHRLMQYGINSTVYEANTRIGGRMYSNTGFFSDNRVVEWGGEFISTEHTAIRNLAHQLGLQLEDVNKLSVGDEETYLINGQLYNENDLLDEWVGGLYEVMKRAQQDAPWQPFYNSEHTAEHLYYDQISAIEWLESDLGYPSSNWVHKLLLTDLVAEYGLTAENSALNLIYLLAWNTRNSGGLPLAGTDERLHVVGGNDRIMHGMANQLPQGSIETGRKLEAIVGDYAGPYTLSFDTGPDETCDVLVMSLPMNLIKDLDIDTRIWDGFLPQKQQAFLSTNTSSDNCKIILEFSDRHWDMTQIINGREVHQAARSYSDPDKYISTWEGEPGNPSPLGVLVDYNGGVEARNLKNNVIQGVAKPNDVNRLLGYFDQVWPGISAKYTGKALVSNWWDNPYSRGAFTSPAVNTMTVWWGAQWETEGNIYFAGEAYDEEYWSYMNGAIQSGERVALEIHQNY
ncbi:MAG: FAD-dependent oxidoreductase [Gammaproteobacteria bacterium]|nr:FAD-dependent oxidoreductase [Gammaproteobacteria bacterium]